MSGEHRYCATFWFYNGSIVVAEGIHSRLETQTFSQFRDIWMPLDLSNLASFYGILAHAAANLSQNRYGESGLEALAYKTETTEFVNKWLGDLMTAFKDEAFAAILRLLHLKYV
jgi:hypothetical protein